MRNEFDSVILDHKIVRQNEFEVLKYIELEQVAKQELDKLAEINKQEQAQREKLEANQIKENLLVYQEKAKNYQELFNSIKMRVKGLNRVEDILTYIEEIT